MHPKISIIVPIYNVEPHLPKCINSILAQSFKEFELILVNDGSLDHCGDICDKYAKSDSRIKVIHKKNGGVSSARNAGLEAALGDYIGFVDSDDFIDKKMYEILYSNAEIHSSDIVVCDFHKVDENQRCNLDFTNLNTKQRHFTNLEALQQIFMKDSDTTVTGAGNNIKWVVLWNKLFKRNLFENIRFEVGRIYEDELIIHNILYKSNKVTYVNEKLYYYVQSLNSIIRSSFSLKRFDKVYVLKERTNFFKNIKQQELYHRAIKSYIDAFFWNYLAAKSQLTGIDKELKQLKKTLNSDLKTMMINPYFSWKQKVMFILFIISPFLYIHVTKLNGKRLLKAT